MCTEPLWEPNWVVFIIEKANSQVLSLAPRHPHPRCVGLLRCAQERLVSFKAGAFRLIFFFQDRGWTERL